MLKTMRNNTKIVLWIVIAAFLGTIVFAWGMQYTASQQMKNYVAKVNGEKITADEYLFYFDRLARQWETQNPQIEMSEDQRAKLHYDAWRELLRNALMQQQVERYGLGVTDGEIVEFLQKYYYAVPELMQLEVFQTNGQFDYNKYVAIMNSKDPAAGPFWVQIEALVRPKILEFKLSNAVFSTARVSNQDVVNRFKEYNEYYKVKFVLVRSDQFRTQIPPPTEEELKTVFNQNKEKYRQPERAFIKFVRIPKSSGLEDELRVQDEAFKIREGAQKVADSSAFAEVAKKYSQDPTAPQNGGDLGWFGRGQMVTAFDSAVFSLKVGELSEPVRTSFGWHLIKLWGKKKNKDGEQVHASHILLKVEPNPDALEQLKATTEDFARLAAEVGLEKAATERQLTVDSSNIFTRDASITGLGMFTEVNQFVFSNEPGTLSPLYNLPGNYVVVKVEKRLAAGIPNFEDVRNMVRADISRRKMMERSRQRAGEIWQAVQKGTSFEEATARFQETAVTEHIWGWGAWVPTLGDAPAFLGAVIRSHEKKDRFIPPVPTDIGYVLGELLQYLPYNAAHFTAAKDSTLQSLFQKRRTDALNAWVAQLQKDADIEDYRMEVLGANF
ncbi:MAG TPA: peptidylprolyl isomerase [candidate division Zixibacteria bacterium]|nr:peptidylprolyl isomerase [candidate division Zixibacteria bacterium]